MKIELTKQEAQSLLQILDKVQVSGIQAKAMVVQIMSKVAVILQEETANEPAPNQGAEDK